MTNRPPQKQVLYREATARNVERAEIDPEVARYVESCQGLVRSVAWRIHQKLPPHVELEDLIQFGQLGLLEAARSYDPERGAKFSSFAYQRVQGAILDGLSKLGWFSRHHYHSSRYEHLANDYLETGQEDSAGASAEDDARWLKQVSGPMMVVYLASQGRPDDEGGETSGPQLADEKSPSPVEAAGARELHGCLHDLIDQLPSDAGRLIRLVYFEGLTLKAAGEQLSISKAWASRLHEKTLQRLSRALSLLGADD